MRHGKKNYRRILMTAERRYSARHPVDLKVEVLYGRRRFNGARARNLSNQGMLLSLPKVTLPPGTPVTLELSCLGREWLIAAVVIHRGLEGVGVMFREPQPALYQGVIQGELPRAAADALDTPPRPQPVRRRPLLPRH
jgi:hypothetical protein